MKHTMQVVHTMDDDGVWLYCSCHAEIHLGFGPTVEEVVEAAGVHKNEAILAGLREGAEREREAGGEPRCGDGVRGVADVDGEGEDPAVG